MRGETKTTSLFPIYVSIAFLFSCYFEKHKMRTLGLPNLLPYISQFYTSVHIGYSLHTLSRTYTHT